MFGFYYVSTRGRVSRKAYLLAGFLPFLILGFLAGFVVAVSGSTEAEAFRWVGTLAIASLWPQLAMVIKRLHDLGLSGWFCVLYVLPVINWFLIFALIVFHGYPGTNRFGPDPLTNSDDSPLEYGAGH